MTTASPLNLTDMQIATRGTLFTLKFDFGKNNYFLCRDSKEGTIEELPFTTCARKNPTIGERIAWLKRQIVDHFAERVPEIKTAIKGKKFFEICKMVLVIGAYDASDNFLPEAFHVIPKAATPEGSKRVRERMLTRVRRIDFEICLP